MRRRGRKTAHGDDRVTPAMTAQEERGLTIERRRQLATAGRSTISRAERGLQTLRPETVVKLSKALKVSPRRISEGG